MALSLGSGDFRGGNVFKLGDTLLEVFPFQREDGQTTIYHVLCSLAAAASDLIVTSPSVLPSALCRAGKMENMRRPLDHHLKNLLARTTVLVGNLLRDFTRLYLSPQVREQRVVFLLKFG